MHQPAFWTRTTAALVLLAAGASATRAQIVGATRVAAGLDGPMALAHAPGDPNRLFIAEREGTIRILDLASGSLEFPPASTMAVTVYVDGSGIDMGCGRFYQPQPMLRQSLFRRLPALLLHSHV